MKFTTKWSRTIAIIVSLVVVGALFGLMVLWHPLVYIFLGAFGLYLVVDAIVKDRRAAQKKAR